MAILAMLEHGQDARGTSRVENLPWLQGKNRGPQEQASALIHKKQRELGKFALRFASSKKRFEIFTRERWRLY